MKNFNNISAKAIADKALLRLGIHILATGYLKKRAFCFTEVTRNDKEINKKADTVFNSKEKIKIKKVFCKKKKNIQTLFFAAACWSAPLSVFDIPMLIPAMSAPLSPFVAPAPYFLFFPIWFF